MKQTLLVWLVSILGLAFSHSHHHHHHHHHDRIEPLDHRHLAEDAAAAAAEPRVCGNDGDTTAADEAAQQRAVEIYKNSAANSGRQATIEIPVCFHIVTDKKGNGNVDNDQLQEQLDALQRGYSSASCCDTEQEWCNPGDCSVDTGFTFVMATLDDESGAVVEGVTTTDVSEVSACVIRTENNKWGQGNEVNEMKQSLRKGGRTVLNIYTLASSQYLGYATWPWRYDSDPGLDGVIVDYRTLPGGSKAAYNEGDTAVHEVGHWLGLLHTFQGGCSASDGVEDTPAQASAATGCSASMAERDTCPEDEGTDNVFNFMDYSFDQCMFEFTPGQTTLMKAVWDIYRLGNSGPRDIVTLEFGEPSATLFLAPGEYQVYRMDFDTKQAPVTCTTTGSEGNADLYLNVDELPSRTRSDYCSSRNAGSNEQCGFIIATKRFMERLIDFFLELFGRSRDSTRSKTLYAAVTATSSTAVQGLRIVCGS